MSVMAASIASAGSASSSKSSGSRGRRYKTISKSSTVDEMLFGSNSRSHSAPKERELPFLDPKSKHSSSFSAQIHASKRTKENDEIQVITKDMIRKLRIPRDDPSRQTMILTPTEYMRIKQASRVMTKAEQDSYVDNLKKERQRLQEESDQRKNFMHTMELRRQQNEKLSDLEQEAKEKSEYLLSKAQEQLEEQEDEIKKLNELILNAKCHAIRDAQLVEKSEIKREMLEEDKRLDEMMESDRLRALKEYEERENAKRHDRLRGAQVLHQQIEEREQAALLDEERKDQETKSMLQYLEKLQKEDMQDLIRKRELQRHVMEDVARANEAIQRQKEHQKDREKLEEYKVMEYLKEKAAREEAYEKEKERLKTEKEKEIARLRAQQERAKDKQAEKDALRAKRNQEEAEREWRRKEKDEAIKKAQTEEMLKAARKEQVMDKEHYLAVQAARDRAEFERVLDAQREQASRDEANDYDFQNRRAHYAKEVRLQIKDKEKERVLARQTFFEEGIKLDQEAKERRQKLDEIKRRKLKELKEAGVNDKYVNEVARRIEAPAQSS